MSLHFELITPAGTVFRQEVDAVTLPTVEGEISILSQHIPLVAALVPGVARLKTVKAEEEVAVSGGFIEVTAGNHVRVLADTVERGFELDVSVLEVAKQRAEAIMKTAVRSDEATFAAAAAALERELARYKVAIKHRKTGHKPLIDNFIVPPNENPV